MKNKLLSPFNSVFKVVIVTVFMLTIISCNSKTKSEVTPIDLKWEYRVDPLGIDNQD